MMVTGHTAKVAPLYRKFHPFHLEILRRISGKQHGRANPRLVTDWGIINYKIQKS